jgi:hypothetical protein
MGKFNKGLHRDTDPLDQPEGTYRYAKNIAIEPNSGAVQFERGTEMSSLILGAYNPLPSPPVVAPTAGYRAVGKIVLQDDKVVIFSVFPDISGSQTYWLNAGISEIGIFDPVDNTYTTLYNDYAQVPNNEKPLNFRQEYPIQGEYKIDSTGRVSIYWTDDNEVMRFMRIYAPPTTGVAFDIETLNIFPLLSTAPFPILNTIISGVLGSGMYALTVALVNDEGTPTNYVNISNWVKITDDAESGSVAEVGQSVFVTGHHTGNLNNMSVMTYDGCPADFPSGKGITWTVSNLDPRYSFIRPVIVYKIGGVIECIKLQDIDYDAAISTSMDVSYTGNETAEAELLTNILIARESYVKAKTVSQVDDVLYWGNLVKSKIDVDYQPYANNIEIEAVYGNPNFQSNAWIQGINGWQQVNMRPDQSGAQRTAHEQYFHKGYQRDETYAFYITWIMADGNETVAYHIPGREPLDISIYAGQNTVSGNPFLESEHATPGSAQLSFASAAANAIPARDMGTGPTSEQWSLMPNSDIEIYKITTYGATIDPNSMGYWENASEYYPPDPVNYGIPLNADGTPNLNKTALMNTNVRHHHFPSANNSENSVAGEGGHIWGKQNFGNHTARNVVNPLGFRVKNVPIPASLVGKVIAYKIYYARRDEANTTVLDTGILNATPSYHGPPECGRWGAGHGTPGWGDSGACPQATLNHPKNGFEAAGFSSNCWANWVTYAVQNPPGGLDYTGTGMLDPNTPVPFMALDNNTGGQVVCTPFSAVHAPYSNVGDDRWGNTGNPGCCDNNAIGGFDVCWNTKRRLTDIPAANHFTFNGLHSHINSPDTSNAAFIKIQRHLNIGRLTTGNSQLLGSSWIRLDNTGSSVRNSTKSCTFFNWVLMPPEDYGTAKTTGLLYDVPVVQSGGAPIGERQTLRALRSGTMRKIDADVNVAVSGSMAGNIRNAGGDQTFYLSTHNNILTHNFIMWMNHYMGFAHMTFLSAQACGTGGIRGDVENWGANYPSYHRFHHHWYFNKFDAWDGQGSWAYRDMNVGNSTMYGLAPTANANWEDGWCSCFNYASYTCDFVGTSANFLQGLQPNQVYDWVADGNIDEAKQSTAYAGIHRDIANVYNTFDMQSDLVYTGCTEDITTLVIPPVTGLMYNPGTVIFGGDTFIGYYCETRHMKSKGQSTHTLEGPNYCAGGNQIDGPPNCCDNGPCWQSGTGNCENLDFAGGANQNQGYLWQSDRWTHYAYGVFGEMPSDTSTDICQQLYITESKINIVERYTGNDVNEDFFPAVHRQSPNIVNWNSGPRLFTYNQDMGSLMNLYPTVVFNYLNKTSKQTDFPTRIIRSVRYNKSGLVDNFRSYLPGQYRDLPRNRGELWNLAIYDNVLLPQLERTLMKTKGKESLSTGGGIGDISEIALGDGDLFEKDPNEILYTERGYAGTLSQWSICTSRFGHLSVDKKTGKIFLLSDKLEEISSYGMRFFFAKRLTTWALQAYDLPYNIDLPTLNIGIIASFDPEYSRYIITKLDKMPQQAFITGWNTPSIANGGSGGNISWNDEHRAYQIEGSGGIQTLISFEDNTYFYDRSWTVSYYPALKVWGSIHDFWPRMYFYTTNKLYSLPPGQQTIWVHNFATGKNSLTAKYNIGDYYGVGYDIVFEYIDNSSPTDNKLFYNIEYTIDVEVPADLDSGARHPLQDSGFHKYYVYNSRQLSEEISLIEPEGQNNFLWSTASVRRRERTWYAKGFRDDRDEAPVTPGQVLDAPMNTPILVSDYSTADISINNTAYSAPLPKTWNQRRKMVDKWMAVRLISSPPYQLTGGALGSNVKNLVTLHHASTNKRKTTR